MVQKIRHLPGSDSNVRVMRLHALGVCIFGFSFLVACDALEEPASEQIHILNTESTGSELLIAEPLRLRSIRDIDPQAVRALVLVNGVETELQRNASGLFAGQIEVPAQSSFTVSVEYYEWYAGEKLTLAKTEQAVTTSAQDTTLTLQRNDYNYSFDSDNDGVSNILEREYNTSPLDSAQLPQLVSIDVFVPRPSRLENIGFNNYQIEASVGSISHAAESSIGEYRNTFTVVREDPLNVNVRIVETVTGQQLTIGTQSIQVAGVQDSQSVIVSADDYNFELDEDADGVSNLDELAVGSDPFTPPEAAPLTAFSLTFDIPAEIANPSEVYGQLLVNGQNVVLSRNDNRYTATGTVQQGQSADIALVINNTYEGQVLTLASFDNVLQPMDGQSFELQDFSLQHDVDGDGELNYLELSQGSDPFNPPVAQCTPVNESLFLSLSDDAYVWNGRLFDSVDLRVDSDRRVSLIRYQYDISRGSVVGAELSLTVSDDEGDGLVSIYSVPYFDWSDTSSRLATPALLTPVASLDGDFDRDVQYNFSLDPSAITEDFTLVIVQEDDGNDIAFVSSDGFTPPALQVVVERCE